MIYYATVHWKSDRWIDIQLEMLRRYNSAGNYRVYAFLDDVAESHRSKFDLVLQDPAATHEVKLDVLANRILEDADSEDDWIVFLDGDAFPIAAVSEVLSEQIREHHLVAIQRLEDLGEKQPHPSFCATTVGFWKDIRGTWAKGYKWINAMGNPETDVGGALLGLLEQRHVSWLPLHRTNTVNINPVFFGIYGDVVYHHGAGFRGGGCRIIWYERGLYEIYKRPDARILNNVFPRKYLKAVRNSWIHPEGRLKRKIARELQPLQEEIYQKIKADPEYVRSFIQ